MLKKITMLLAVGLLLVTAGGCKSNTRPDFSELLLRMEREDKQLDADFSQAFYSDSCWYIFLTFLSENDVLVRATEDENRRLLSVSVSMMDGGIEGSAEAFVKIASTVAKAYCDIENTDEFLADTGLYDEGIIFSDECRTYECGRYRADFYNSAFGSQLKIDYII